MYHKRVQMQKEKDNRIFMQFFMNYMFSCAVHLIWPRLWIQRKVEHALYHILRNKVIEQVSQLLTQSQLIQTWKWCICQMQSLRKNPFGNALGISSTSSPRS